jgi:hypothetical protein
MPTIYFAIYLFLFGLLFLLNKLFLLLFGSQVVNTLFLLVPFMVQPYAGELKTLSVVVAAAAAAAAAAATLAVVFYWL